MTATIPFVQDCFERFNEQIFEGKLPPIPVSLSRARRFLGKVEYRIERNFFGKEVGYHDFRMRISTSFDLPPEELEDVVIHEMIHYYLLYFKIEDTSSHGKVFRQMMKRINREFGRNVTIRHNKDASTTGGTKRHYVCVTELRNGASPIGNSGLTVCASTKVLYIHRCFKRSLNVKGVSWYCSTNPWFDRFPRSLTPKIYFVDEAELRAALTDAQPLICNGRTLQPKNPDGH